TRVVGNVSHWNSSAAVNGFGTRHQRILDVVQVLLFPRSLSLSNFPINPFRTFRIILNLQHFRSVYLSLQDEHSKAIASTVPRKMTEERAMIAISVAPIWLIFSWTVTPWMRLMRKYRRLSTICWEFFRNT